LNSARLRPQALADQRNEVRHYRREGGSRLAVRFVNASDRALQQIELDPGLGSPVLGKYLGITGLKTWRLAKFPLIWVYFEKRDHLDVVRLLGQRQDVSGILGAEFDGS
jgi:toxin ParE1/3/4